MKVTVRLTSLLLALVLLVAPVMAGAAKKSAGSDTLKQYVDDLRKNPRDKALREKIIKMAAGMKHAPVLPEEAERSMARGTIFAEKADDTAGYKRAISEFESAVRAAPWLGLAYFNLGIMQEKSGLFKEAIQSFRYYLLASPDAKNSREVKNKIYALEAEAEAMEAGQNAPAPEPPAGTGATAAGKQLAIAGKSNLEIEPADKELRLIKMPKSPDQKVKPPDFSGNWYFKESIRGEEVPIQAFEITKSSNGDLMLVPPKRAGDSYATVNIFEIADKTLKIQMKWKMKSVVGYWKTETYVLKMSDDGTKLAGSHNQQSVGGRNIDLDRVLYRQ